MSVSIIIPCYNEKHAIRETIKAISIILDETNFTNFDIIAINDGSTDGSKDILDSLANEYHDKKLKVIHHNRNQGYGAALKSGIRKSRSEYICITDADGTYPNNRIPELIRTTQKRELDMLVGARIGDNVDYSKLRSIPKLILVPWVSYLCGTDIPDMNSGLRIFKREIALKYLNLLPDGFSFTTTITICLSRNKYLIEFTPISYSKRIGRSHIKPLNDTLKFVQLIARTGMYFAPMRLLLPAVVFFGLMAILSGSYDVYTLQNLTDKTILFTFTSMNILMFALLADMIDKRSAS